MKGLIATLTVFFGLSGAYLLFPDKFFGIIFISTGTILAFKFLSLFTGISVSLIDLFYDWKIEKNKQ